MTPTHPLRMESLLRPGLGLFQGLQLSLLRWFKGQRGLITGGADIIAVSEFLIQAKINYNVFIISSPKCLVADSTVYRSRLAML